MNAEEYATRCTELFGSPEYTDEQIDDRFFVERVTREREKAERVEVAIRTLLDEVNSGEAGLVVPAIVHALTRGHRYLQNSLVDILIKALGTYGALPKEGFTDGRNEYAHKQCAKLREFFKDEYFYRDGRK